MHNLSCKFCLCQLKLDCDTRHLVACAISMGVLGTVVHSESSVILRDVPIITPTGDVIVPELSLEVRPSLLRKLKLDAGLFILRFGYVC